MLIKEVAGEFDGKVKVVTEEYGNSPMATRFGVRRYPVVFVDDVLVARPKDFGFAGPEDVGTGRYVPWREAQNQARFKDDLRRFVNRRLKGETVEGFDTADVSAAADDGPATLPALPAADFSGKPIGAPGGRVVLVEMWATWCPPCLATMKWMNELQKTHGDRVTIVAVAVDSKEDDVRKVVADLNPSYHVVVGSPDLLKSLGSVAAVPKLFIFDRNGERAEVMYGAAPDLHERIE
ncbi:MAG TPA: TlpA disulfide reductase family protein, partial [Vicinamibacterales bacterium]